MESSYCYFIKQEAQSNESLNKRESEDARESMSNEQDESNSTKSDSSESTSSKTKLEDETMSDINALKKNLYNEEEFRSINHGEPIHIFLKIKPLSIQEIVKQKDEKYYAYYADTGVSVIPPKSSVWAQNKQSAQNLMQTIFHFSYVFQQKITQKDFFMATIYPCFEKFFNGDNLLIFNYGVTNSGKTYTMQGTNTDPGLIPRSLDFLFESLKESSTNWENTSIDLSSNSVFKYKPDKFNEICQLSETELNQELLHKESILRLTNSKDLERFDSMRDLSRNFGDSTPGGFSLEASKKFGSLDSLSTIANGHNENNTAFSLNIIKLPPNKRYAVWLSFYEVYNDSVYDLLTMPTSKNRTTQAGGERPQLKIREDSNRIPYVENLTHIPVCNTREAIRILKYGEKNLQKSNNSINANSSRSHAVFCLKIVSIDFNSKNQLIASINQLSFCDLAGIERSSKTQAVGKTQKEASFINQSLSSLSRCINTMMYNQKNKNNPQQIPYRVNKLTRLFQAYFEGKSMVKMIVNFNPSVTCFDESVGVLKFSSIANQIQLTLNDEKKVEYKIDLNTNSPSKNSQTVAWESDCEDDEDEEDEDDSEEEEETEEDEEDEEDDEEEEETEQETECQESVDDDDEEEEESVENQEDDEEETEETEEDESEECEETSEEGNSEDDDEEEDDEDEDEEEDEEEEEDEDEEEEEEEEESEETIENKTQNTTVKKQLKVKIEDSIRANKSCSKKIHKTFQKTPGMKKTFHKLNATDTKCLEKKKNIHKSINKTISRANLSQLKSSKYDDLSKDQLVSLCKNMKKDIDHAKIEYTKYESNLRSELVSTWSKRVEDTDTYYQEQIRMQRSQVEETYLKRMDMLEKLLNKKADERIEQLKQEKDTELEKLRDQLTTSNQEVKSLTEENLRLKEETDRLLKLNDDLNEKLREKIAEYDMIVDKNNYLTTNLLNSTAINLSIIHPSNKVISPKKLGKIGEETKNETETTELEEEEEEEEEESVEETQEETQEESESTEEEESEESEEETEEETEIEESQAEPTQADQETELEETNTTIEKSSLKPKKVFADQEAQTELVETKSIEVEANLPNEELEKIKIVFDLKVAEVASLSDKIKSIENLNNQLNKLLKAKSQQEGEFNTKIRQLEKELIDSENSNKANESQIKSLLAQKQQLTEMYDKLEIDYNKLKHSLEDSEVTIKRLESKIGELEKDGQQLKNEIAQNKININELTKELNDKKSKLEKDVIQIDELEKAITKLSDDLTKKNFAYEILENDLQFKQNQVEKLNSELEETKASKSKLEEYNAITTANAKRALESVEIKVEKEIKEEPTERVEEKPPKKSSSSKLSMSTKTSDEKSIKTKKSSLSKKSTDLKSIPELKKSKKSKDRVSSIDFSQDENDQPTSKLSKVTKSNKITKKPKEEVSDNESVSVSEKETKKNSKELDTDEVNSTNVSNVSSNVLKPTCNLTKKKSTLNRLTEMIAKSPILEPLRKRPQRQINLKSSASNASDTAASLSILQNSTNNMSSISKTGTLESKTDKSVKARKASTSKIQKVEELENAAPEVAEVETGRKTRKKKA